MMISVPGIPKAQPRTKAVSFGGHARVYTPNTAAAWKDQIAIEVRRHPDFPESPWTGPIMIDMLFLMPRPKRLCRKKDPPGPLPCIARPDIDNEIKAGFDALVDAGLFKDDAQVYQLVAKKFYHEIDGRPGAEIIITPISCEAR